MRQGSSKRLNRPVAVTLALVLLAAAALLAVAEVSGGLAGKAEPKAMFSACTPGHPAGPGLFVADSDLSNPVRLTTPRTDLPNAEVDSPGTASGCDIGAWSPDGTRAVVSRTMYLYLLDLQALIEYPGQEPVPLTDPSGEHLGGGNPCWSPDGTRIVYHNDDGVVVVNADGSGYRVIAPVGVRAREPEWSPDGSSIAFRCGPEGYAHLYLATNIDGPGEPKVRQLYDDPEWQECWPHWSPDSTTLAFTRVPTGEIGQHGDIWLLDVASGQEVLLTDTPEVDEQALGWSPFDGELYYMELAPEPGGVDHLVRMQADGTEVDRFEREVRPAGRLTWAMVGTWIEGVYALPGERVAAKLGLQDADEVAEAIADVGYPGTLEPLDVTRGASTRDWTLLEPQADAGILSAHGYAGSPEDQALRGPSHLFDLHFGNRPLSRPDDLALLTFEDLYLGDRLGRPVTGPALAGGVRTIPFAALELSITSTSRHPNGDIGLWVTVRALDRSGEVMVDVNGDVRLGTYRFAPEEYWETQNKVWPVDPEIVTLRRGAWSGKVVVPAPRPGTRLLAYWGDIAAYSDPLVPEQQARHEAGMGASSGASSGGGGRAEPRYTWLAEPTRSEAVQVLTNMKNVAVAVQMFMFDQDWVLPKTNDTAELMELLGPYLNDQSVFLRPGTDEPAVQFLFDPGVSYSSVAEPAAALMAVVDYHPEWRVEAYLDGHAILLPKGEAVAWAADADFMAEALHVQSNMQRLGLAMRSYLLEHAGIFPKADSVDEMLRRLGPHLAAESILVHATIGDPLDVRYLARSGAAVSPTNAAETAFAEATCATLPGLRVAAYADGHAESKPSGEGGSGGGGWGLTAVLVNMEQLALAMRAYLADHNNRFPAATDGRSLVAALDTYLDPRLLFTRPGTKDEVVVRYVMKPGTTWGNIPGREAHTVPVFVASYSPEFTVMVDAQMIASIRGKD